MKIALAAGHAGFELKKKLKAFVESLGHEVEDFGAHELDPADDYPDFVIPAARAVAEGKADRAIIIGGSGQGEAMGANRMKGVRAAVLHGGAMDKVVRLSREHNDANVLALGARLMDSNVAKRAVETWLNTKFPGDERHVRRIKKLDQ